MEGVDIVAELMKVAATTAPKGVGQDFVDVKVASKEEIAKIAEEMFRIAKERDDPGFERDGNNLKNSEGLVLIGVREHPGPGLDCGACGHESCADFAQASKTGANTDFVGPSCMIRLLDMGIALGSAAKTAQIHNVDNRIMYRVGVAARNLNILDSKVVMGIPLSVTSKSPYFDR